MATQDETAPSLPAPVELQFQLNRRYEPVQFTARMVTFYGIMFRVVCLEYLPVVRGSLAEA